ncbi:MAG: hypothetical protein ACJAVK_000689 [Akkermansiaceae bacterium]|jgi:hypothetical protein
MAAWIMRDAESALAQMMEGSTRKHSSMHWRNMIAKKFSLGSPRRARNTLPCSGPSTRVTRPSRWAVIDPRSSLNWALDHKAYQLKEILSEIFAIDNAE